MVQYFELDLSDVATRGTLNFTADLSSGEPIKLAISVYRKGNVPFGDVCNPKVESTGVYVPQKRCSRTQEGKTLTTVCKDGSQIQYFHPMVKYDSFKEEVETEEDARETARVFSSVSSIHNGVTHLPVQKYSAHLTDSATISHMNDKIIGKLVAWRVQVMDLLDVITTQKWSRDESIKKQIKWTTNQVDRAIVGMSNFRGGAIEIMHKDALKTFIDGTESNQLADLVYNVANCHKLEVISFPYSFFKAYLVWTRFVDVKGENDDVVRAYGCDNWVLGQRERDAARKIRRSPMET